MIHAKLIAFKAHGANGARAVQNAVGVFKKEYERQRHMLNMRECNAVTHLRLVNAAVVHANKSACSLTGLCGALAARIVIEALNIERSGSNSGPKEMQNAQANGLYQTVCSTWSAIRRLA